MQVLTATDPQVIGDILLGLGGRSGALWWLVGAEQGHAAAVENMARTREWSNDDAFWRPIAHQKLRRARRELRKAQAEFREMTSNRELEYQTRNDARLLVGE